MLQAGRCNPTATHSNTQSLPHCGGAAHRKSNAGRRRVLASSRAGREDILRQTEAGSAVLAAAADAQQAATAAAVREAYKSGKLAFGFSAGGLLFPVSACAPHLHIHLGRRPNQAHHCQTGTQSLPLTQLWAYDNRAPGQHQALCAMLMGCTCSAAWAPVSRTQEPPPSDASSCCNCHATLYEYCTCAALCLMCCCSTTWGWQRSCSGWA